MRALIKKELTEVLVPFGIAFLVITMVWLGSVRFWDALLPPASDLMMVVAGSAALAGVVLGYLQFSVERWRGKIGYLCHRGTGIEGAFLAKVVAGLLGTFLIGLGPPLIYALASAQFSPNASIVQYSLLPVYASAATAGASLYGLGALSASLRRRSIAGILLIPIGAFALWFISEMCGSPWGNATHAWAFPAMHVVVALVLLALVLRLSRSGVDRDLPLPRGLQLAAVALALPLVFLPCDMGVSVLKTMLIDEVRSEYPLIARDRANGEMFPVLRGESGEFFRMEAGGRLGEKVQLNARTDAETGSDVVFWGRSGFLGASDPQPPTEGITRPRRFEARGGLTPIALQYRTVRSSYSSQYGLQPSVRIQLDSRRGLVRAFGWVFDPRREGVGDRGPSLPFAIELGKPRGEPFSPETIAFQGEDGAVARYIQELESADPAPPELEAERVFDPFSGNQELKVRVGNCLLDPKDGTFWRLDVLDTEAPLERVELPGGDRFVRLQSLYSRPELTYGRYQSSWTDPVVVGERGKYVWNGRDLVEFVPSETYATADEAASFLRYRVVVEDPDPVRWTVRVLDAKDDREVFSYAYAPRTSMGSFATSAAQASVLLRSPLANTLLFTGIVRQRTERGVELQADLLAGGKRPWLFVLALAVAVACTGACARLLRRRNASWIEIVLGSAFGLLFGPVALLVVWLLEPKGRARELPVARAVPEPALVIQSV